ncbi:CdaR family protein [Gracilibacillus massiliensis]|uniref:CdaR family protein n=1 Tax=Gracilibacillus massiliensis TaxID=1564956 RepID=UPI00071DC202|nr:CdaR family protein [Gracilibacillus massiliensis]
MNKWLEKPWVIRVVALLLSVLLFVVVAFDENVGEDDDGFENPFGITNKTQPLEDVPVQTQIDEEKYVVSGVPETVKVTLQGSVSIVTSTELQRNFDVFVNLEGLEPGTHTVPLEYSGITDRLNVYIEPQEVEVSIEERASQEFDVTIDVVNRDKVEAGFEVANVIADPETITVTSSKSIVDNIAIIKGFVDVEGFNETQTVENVPIKVYDNEGNELNVRIDPPTVEVTVDMANPNKQVPVSVETTNELPEGLRLNGLEPETEEVQVFASEDYLAQLDQITTKPIDLSEITESGTMEVELDVSSDIRKIGTDTVTINVDIESIEEEVLEDVAINVVGGSEEFSVSFVEPSTESMNLTVRGYPSDITNLTAEDLQLSIDIGDLAAGEHQVPVELERPQELEEDVEIELEYEQVTVNIEQEE